MKLDNKLVTLAILLLFSISESNQAFGKTTNVGKEVVETSLRKAPYLIYNGVNTEYIILWQLHNTQTVQLKWGTDTTYSVGSIETTEYGADHQHKYKFTELIPGTKYYYDLVINSIHYKGDFYSAPAEDAHSVKFIAYGDIRVQPGSDREQINNNRVAKRILDLYASDSEYQGIIPFSGDILYRGKYEDNWDLLLNSQYENTKTLFSKVGYQIAVGNHEDVDESDLFRKYFPSYPYHVNNAYYYAFDYGPVRFIILDLYGASYTSDSQQMIWFENELQSTTKKWKIVVMHQTGYSLGHHGYSQKVIDRIVPLCEQNGVKLVIGGHNHLYARFRVNGINYVTTGGAGANVSTSYEPTPYDQYIEEVAYKYHFCKIEINDDKLFFEAVDDSGNTFDNFTVSLNENIFRLNIDTEGLGSVKINPDSNYYHAGTDVSLAAVPDSGWEFESWSGDLSGSTSPVNLTIDGNKNITAKFKNPNGGTIDLQIKSSSDDAEEKVGEGKVYLKSSDLELVEDGSEQIVGMRFTNVEIPEGATITNAYIQFTADETDAVNCTLAIKGEAVDNASTFLEESKNISNREVTTATVTWTPPFWRVVGESGSKQQTPELKTVIQEIVNRSAWNSGNNLSIIVFGSGVRTAESYNGSVTDAAKLHIEYSTVTSVCKNKDKTIPEEYAFGSYPNPFNPSTKIKFTIPNSGRVKVVVYDMLGKEISKMVDKYYKKGNYNIMWNAELSNGNKLPSGIYIARIEAGNYIKSIKMTLLK